MTNERLHVDDFHRMPSDINGNPRYAVHFLRLNTEAESFDPSLTVTQKYRIALNRARPFGGKKYHNKRFGGGIVFQEYNLDHLVEQLNNQLRQDGKQ